MSRCIQKILFIYLFIYLFFADLTVLNLFSICAKFQVFYAGESLIGVVLLLTSVSDYETKNIGGNKVNWTYWAFWYIELQAIF